MDRAYNGKQAIDKVKNLYKIQGSTYGLIIMDLSMPFMDGYEATKLIRNFHREHNLIQPVIVVSTGHIEEDYIRKAWSVQVDEIVEKPINHEVIKALLKEILEVE